MWSKATFSRLILCLFCAAGCVSAIAQPEDFTQIWPASWIRAAQGPQKDFGVFYFRHHCMLEKVPDSLLIHTSGDNRYQLFVNGQLATWGPQRGDLNHWKYETTNIAHLLKPGKNVLAAVVWNYGAYPPDAQFTVQTAFLLAAANKAYRHLNTGKAWKAVYDAGYSPIPVDRTQINGYFGAGATEKLDMAKTLHHWQLEATADSTWPAAEVIETAMARSCIWASRWKLEPRNIEMETLQWQRFAAVRISEGATIPEGFPQQPKDVVIPSGQSVRLVFDMGTTTTAFPQLHFSGGKGAHIQMKYAEAPYEPNGLRTSQKGNRGEVSGKVFYGVYDQCLPDGAAQRVYQPLWWRAFRYVEIVVTTAHEPLVLHDYRACYLTYLFTTRAQLHLQGTGLAAKPATIAQMLEVGERTLRLCSHETYMDCPYYEQTQFEGDTRVQALVSYYLFGNAELAKNALIQFDWSRNEMGFVSARYPANSSYYIPNFSIFWIGMLYDYMMHVGDRAFIAEKIQGVRTIIQYFLDRQRPDGSIARPDFHNFVDWSFPKGEPAFDSSGRSALVDLHVLMALQWAVQLEEYAAKEADAVAMAKLQVYKQQISRLKTTLKKLYYRPQSMLFADNAGANAPFSVHANALAVLCGVVPATEAAGLLQRAMAAKDLTQPTIYWHFYLFEALAKAGLGNDYLKHTGVWQQMLDAGCTTWPETGLKSRSECHAWGASPNYHLYKILLGVQPAAPGFSKVTIAPHPGGADSISGVVPTPAGDVAVSLQRTAPGNWQANIHLPAGVSGQLVWQGRQYSLQPGKQTLLLK